MERQHDRATLVLFPGLDGTGELFGPFLERVNSHLNPRVIPLPTRAPQTWELMINCIEANLPPGEILLLAESFSGRLGSTA